MGDLKALLTPQQGEKWEKVERHRRREVGLRAQDFSGAGVDLLRLAQGEKADSDGAREVLEQYEIELDRVLREWSELGKREKIERDDGVVEFDAMQERMKKMGEVSRRVRDLNRATLSRLEPVTTPEQFGAIMSAFRGRAHPRVYRNSHASTVLDAALGFDDLNTEQRRQIEEMRASYMRDAAPLNDAWAKAIESDEEEAGSASLAMMSRFRFMGEEGGTGGGKSDVNDARKARKELDDRVKSRLKEVLNEGQRSRLPAKKRDAEDGNVRFRIGGGGFDEDEDE
jgi:hypothetical protein